MYELTSGFDFFRKKHVLHGKTNLAYICEIISTSDFYFVLFNRWRSMLSVNWQAVVSFSYV